MALTSAPRRLALLLVVLAATGCATRPRLGTATRAPTAQELREEIVRFARARAGDDLSILALSGGGQNGAFGAGILRGWREAGRPRFDVVTGISTGALQASHAFLDTPRDDDALERVYTRVRKHDVFCLRNVVAMPFEASAADFGPLRRLIEEVFDDATIDRVAAASEGGRRLLLVGTANLDSGRLAVWDLGAVARKRDYAIYRAILLAAASPPVAAEPVALGGDLHADGAVVGNVFVPDAEPYLGADDLRRHHEIGRQRNGGRDPKARLYVIYNGLLVSGAHRVELGLVPIATRSLDLLTDTAGRGSLWYLYGTAQRRGQEFRYVRIPERLRPQADDPLAFDPAKMRALYDAGVALGRDPASWGTEPPPVTEDDARVASPGAPR